MKIAIGCDHAGFALKNHIYDYLKNKGYEIDDLGTYSAESVDYPVYGEKVARAVASGQYERGILICGTGIGISLAANKVRGIRAAVCSEPYSARLTVMHNDANIIAFGARVVGDALAEMIVDEFLNASFLGERHQRRVDMLKQLDEGETLIK